MKHAYLIIAHNQFSILNKLVHLLDDRDNDIYIHIDAKADLSTFSKEECLENIKASEVTFVPSMSVYWGGDSLITCELFLLEQAIKKKHDYYHLLSGVDLPIKTQKEIHAFFEENIGTEYIHFDSKNPNEWPDKYNYYYFFQNSSNPFFKMLNYKIVGVQKKFSLIRKHSPYYKGSNWFSITDRLAKYLVSEKKSIIEQFKYTWACDEVFLQTIVMKSEFQNFLPKCAFDNNYHSCLRYIDWNRGNPYVFTSIDFDELIHSDYLFARKFSDQEEEIVEKIYKYILEKQQTAL